MLLGRSGEGFLQWLKLRRRQREGSGEVQMIARRGSKSSMMASLEEGEQWWLVVG